MSQLPPRLLERLKRRGIIKKVDESNQPRSTATKLNIECDPDHEEIIAEDYSDSSDSDGEAFGESAEPDNAESVPRIEKGPESPERGEESELPDGSAIGCPNKYNIYHECSKYCFDHYSCPDSVTPTIEQRKQLALVLRAYPLPNEWQVVYDPGVKTFYFWNIVTNLVSWLPPVMNGPVFVSADEMRKSMKANTE